ncbi:MAG TPA: ribbon-helix-helix domain-containing protein [Thermoplasmata archaeon]|nr:ribbon-helix-helix domain-containing protein [Thermoplasmata archaeon]
METVSLKLTKQQARALEKAAKERGFPSKSEFVRYALARALEEELDVKTVEEIFEARRQVREGRTVPLERLVAEG